MLGIIFLGFLSLLVGGIIGLAIWSLWTEHLYDKACALLRATSKTPTITGDLLVQVNDRTYKVGTLKVEAYPKFNEETGIAYWSDPSLDSLFKYRAEEICRNGVRISPDIHIPPCQITNIEIANIKREK